MIGSDSSHHVDAAALACELDWVRSVTMDPVAGVFGPKSLMWRVNREALMFLGAGRAVLLQLAHPWVSAAIAEHSTTLADPVARFHRTFSVFYAMVFGSLGQAVAAARRLHAQHERIQGILPSAIGCYSARSPYQANDVAALRWVHATLIETAALVHDLILPPLTGAERERYLAESHRFGALFGIPRAALARNWSAFTSYNAAMWESDMLAVSSAARAVGERLLSAPRPWFGIPVWYRDVTAGLLPPRLREAFGMPYGEPQRRNAERALSWVRGNYRLLPGRLRYVGPYHEALSRIRGHREPDWITKGLNRIWIGRPQLPH